MSSSEQGMVVILLGPPGVGKGTQGVMLAEGCGTVGLSASMVSVNGAVPPPTLRTVCVGLGNSSLKFVVW